jgi:hypothetical protein
MKRQPCHRESDVIDAALGNGRFSAGLSGTATVGDSGMSEGVLPDDLRRHVAGCATCREVAEVITMLRRDGAEMEAHASVPAAGQIWWRSAVRARMEAAQAAARPVSWAQGMTAATLFGVVCAALVLTWPSLRRVGGLAGSRLMDGLDGNVLQLLPTMVAAVERSLPLALAVMAVVVIAPLAVLYFALAGED